MPSFWQRGAVQIGCLAGTHSKLDAHKSERERNKPLWTPGQRRIGKLWAAFMLGGLLDILDGVRRLAGCLAVVDIYLADAFCGLDSLVPARNFEDSDRDERAVHRIAGPVWRCVYLVLNGLED